jgi:hypothetical protein
MKDERNNYLYEFQENWNIEQNETWTTKQDIKEELNKGIGKLTKIKQILIMKSSIGQIK